MLKMLTVVFSITANEQGLLLPDMQYKKDMKMTNDIQPNSEPSAGGSSKPHVRRIMKNKKQEVRIEQEQYLELQRCFSELLKQCTGVKFKINPEAWYDNQEIMQLLFISKRTAQHYRDSKLISFSQVGNKIYYKGENIISLLEGNFIKNKF